jgi:MFS family permease
MRSHGMSSGELGTWLAMIVGLGGAIGVLGGGLLADKLASRDRRWYLWLPAIANLACVPFMVAVYSVDNAYTALLLSVIPGLLFNVYLGTTIATTQSLVGLRMRATASAILMLVANIIGLGLGPLSVGILSDYLLPIYGADSLKQAMLILLPFFMCWSSLHFYRGSIDLEHDLDAAPD